MGIVKTEAQRKANAFRVKAKMMAEDEVALKSKPTTWSATMPAYAYTELCAEPRYRKN